MFSFEMLNKARNMTEGGKYINISIIHFYTYTYNYYNYSAYT